MSSCDGVIVTVDFVPVPQLPRGIRPMLGGGAGAPQTCAGERSHSDVTRDLGRAASTEGVTAVPPQQPPPDAARVRIVLPYRTPCASRKARDSRREAGPDRTTRPSTARPCPWPRAGSPGAGSAGSPLQRSATHFARIDSELTPAPRIGEHVVSRLAEAERQTATRRIRTHAGPVAVGAASRRRDASRRAAGAAIRSPRRPVHPARISCRAGSGAAR